MCLSFRRIHSLSLAYARQFFCEDGNPFVGKADISPNRGIFPKEEPYLAYLVREVGIYNANRYGATSLNKKEKPSEFPQKASVLSFGKLC